jgi:hypothetical protein
MIAFFKYAFFILLFAIFMSCREKLDDNLNYSDEDVLVVEGEINDLPGPYSIKLTRSVSFGSNKKANVSDAEVYITDNLENRYDFKESNPGVYYSVLTEFIGKTGGIYILHINTSEGLKYESTPCQIGPPCSLDSVFRSSGSESGLQVSGNISFGSDQDVSLKIDADIALMNVIDSIHLESYSKIHQETHYMSKHYATKHLNSYPVLKSNTNYIKGSSINNLPFFSYNFDIAEEKIIEYDNSNIVCSSTGGKSVFIIRVSTISNETFNFYNSLLAQTGEKDVFFEPLPVQLKGNITCINDKSKKAYGLFQANALVKQFYKVDKQSLFLNKTFEIPSVSYDTISCFIINTDSIRLKRYVPYGSNKSYDVSNAIVYVSDDLNNFYSFIEVVGKPGCYFTDLLRYVRMGVYYVHIKTD